MYVSALIVCSVVFYILYVDGPPTHPGQYLWHRLPYATSRPRLAYRRYLSLSVCMCFCLLADVSLDQTDMVPTLSCLCMPLGTWVGVNMHSYRALTHVCVGSRMCCTHPTTLSKLQLAKGLY